MKLHRRNISTLMLEMTNYLDVNEGFPRHVGKYLKSKKLHHQLIQT